MTDCGIGVGSVSYVFCGEAQACTHPAMYGSWIKTLTRIGLLHSGDDLTIIGNSSYILNSNAVTMSIASSSFATLLGYAVYSCVVTDWATPHP